MGKQQERDPEAALGLPRLPPGRHGLEREFVVKNQRDRLSAGTIAVVAEVGYHDATVSRICAAAGISRRTFYSYFGSKQDCYLEVFDLLIEHLLDTMAPISTQGGWPKLVRDRLAAILEVFAANPDLVRFAIIAPIGAGGQVAARHQEALQQILDALVAAEPGESLEKRPSPIVEQAIMGGMVSLIARQVDEGATTPMQDLLPDLVELLLTPFVGRAEAARARSGGR